MSWLRLLSCTRLLCLVRITDTAPGVELTEEIEELRRQSITLRLRALSNKELNVLKRKVWEDPFFSTKNKNEDEKAIIAI